MRVLSAVVLVALVGVGGAACSLDDPAEVQAETDFCEASSRLGDAVDGLDESSTEAAARRDAVLDAAGDLEDAATDIVEARDAQGENPIEEFNDRLEAIPDDATVTEALSETARAGGDFLADLKTFLDPPDCP